MKLTTLREWYELEERLKHRFDAWSRWRPARMPTKGGEAWLTRQMSLALAPPFLLTPLATWILHPWLPQPEWWLYEAMGAMLLGMAFVAHTEYKKAQEGAGDVSARPP